MVVVVEVVVVVVSGVSRFGALVKRHQLVSQLADGQDLLVVHVAWSMTRPEKSNIVHCVSRRQRSGWVGLWVDGGQDRIDRVGERSNQDSCVSLVVGVATELRDALATDGSIQRGVK